MDHIIKRIVTILKKKMSPILIMGYHYDEVKSEIKAIVHQLLSKASIFQTTIIDNTQIEDTTLPIDDIIDQQDGRMTIDVIQIIFYTTEDLSKD